MHSYVYTSIFLLFWRVNQANCLIKNLSEMGRPALSLDNKHSNAYTKMQTVNRTNQLSRFRHDRKGRGRHGLNDRPIIAPRCASAACVALPS